LVGTGRDTCRKLRDPFAGVHYAPRCGSEIGLYLSRMRGRMPRALGASTKRAVRKEERPLNARLMLAGCSATKPEREASGPGEHAAGARDEHGANKGRGRPPGAGGPKNS
jgi:hypothetical protein